MTLTLEEIDLSDLLFWSRPLDEREAAFEVLRRERPIAHFEDPEVPPGQTMPIPLDGRGYYVVTRHADIVEASRDPQRDGARASVGGYGYPPQTHHRDDIPQHQVRETQGAAH